MEAGKTKLSDQIIKLDLVDAMIQGADPNVSDADSEQISNALPVRPAAPAPARSPPTR